MKLQRYLLSGIVGLLAFSGLSPANAGLITGVTSSNPAAVAVTLSAGVGSETAPTPFPPLPGTFNTGVMTLDIEVFQLHTPVVFTFNYGTGPNSASNQTVYTLTLNVTNRDPFSNAGRMNGFDLTNGSRTALESTVAPTSSVFYVQYSGGLNIPDGFRWGGLNGGGPTIGFNQSATNTVVKTVSWGGSTGATTSSLNFVANPEPATILLGSLAMVPAGIAAHRRRRNAKAALVPAS